MSILLFYGGLIVAGFVLVIGIITVIILTLMGKKLRRQLDEEYGKKNKSRLLRG